MKALAYLKDKEDAISVAQHNVLINEMNETQVFNTYMSSLPEEERNEDVYYAARDAARFRVGKLPLSAVIPDAEDDDNDTEDDDTVTIKRSQLEDILKRLDRLEKRVGICVETKPFHKAPADVMTIEEAAAWAGCGERTISRWAHKGCFTTYRNSGRGYFSKSEIEKSLVYQEYKKKTYGNGHLENESRGNQTQAGESEGTAE